MLQELAPCACGRFCGGWCAGAASSSAFSMLFPGSTGQRCCRDDDEDGGGSLYAYGAGGTVDCTLSLGTPSTRRAEAGVVHNARAAPCKESSGRGSPPRRCANCDTTSTPLWRNGPRGPKSLCNACGIRYKKEERRAAAAAVAPSPAMQDSGTVMSYACGGYARQQHPPTPTQWGCYGAAAANSASFGMYGGGDVGDAASDGPCLSWMLNVMPSSPAFAIRERPTLFQYY